MKGGEMSAARRRLARASSDAYVTSRSYRVIEAMAWWREVARRDMGNRLRLKCAAISLASKLRTREIF